MECPACSAANDADSLFCESCGGSLERTCTDCGGTSKASARFCRQCGQEFDAAPADGEPVATPPSTQRAGRDHRSYTPRHLAEKILSSKSALEGERKQVTVFFADVKSSMQLSEELDPEEWHAILERFFEILSAGVHRFEGTVNQYTGDGIMALFGAPLAHEDHAQRACYAALHLSDALKVYTDQLRVDRGLNFSVRMGINSGEVVVGKIGDDLRMDYTAQGHTVGLAQRMESLAAGGKALLAGSTIDLVRGYFELRDLGETKVKGVEDPVRVAELQGTGTMRTRLDRSRARGLSKFVGRDDELARLETALERALAGDGQVVGVVAEAGSGKSRLCYEFIEKCRSQGITVRTTTGVPHGQATPLEPVLLFYREIFGIAPGDTDSQARQKIAGSVAQTSAEELESLPLLYEFMRVPDPAEASPELGPDEREREVMQLLRRLTIARSRRAPAVLVFEDLHWMDPQTDAVIEWIVDATAGTRTLFLANFRPEYRADWMSRTHYQQIALRPLDAAAAGELLGEWLGPDPSLAGFPELVRDRTGGNPFFMEEVVQSQIESGALVGARGHFRLERPVESLEVPASVQSLLAARIDMLSEETKRLLQTASVIGDEVPDGLLARVSDIEEETLRAVLRRLIQGEFLYEASLYPTLEYAFKHPLTREVAYGSLLRDRKWTVHAAVAKTLEALHGAAADAALVAHHWEQAGQPIEAARWQLRAANKLGLTQAEQTLFHLRKVLELLADVDGPEAATLRGQVRAGLIYATSRASESHDEVVALFDEACRELGDGDSYEGVVIRSTFALTHNGAGHRDEARDIANQAIEMARRIGDPEALASALSQACVAANPVERPEEVLALAEEVEAICGEHPSLSGSLPGANPAANSLALRVVAHLNLGCGEKLEEDLATLRRAVGDSDDAFEQTMLAWATCVVATHRGDVSLAIDASGRLVDLVGGISNAAMAQVAGWARGGALLAAGRPDEAVRHLERAVFLAVDRGISRPVGPRVLAALCDARIALGDGVEARRAAERAVVLASEMRLVRGAADAQLALARACMAIGGDALADADAAMAVAEETLRGVPRSPQLATLALSRARRAELAGDEDARRAALGDAIRHHREMGEPGLVEHVEGML